MKLGVVGLGKMGNAIACRVIHGGYKVIGFDVNQQAVKEAKQIGVEVVADLADLAERVDVIWLMVPVGNPVDSTIETLVSHLDDGDIIVDGGNSYFKNSVQRARVLEKHGIYFLDCGTSGGLHGRDIGFSLMVGGNKRAYEKIIPLLEIIAAKNGFGYMGPSGSGHYVKMVHNGIEYALLQAYAQGFHLLKEGAYQDLDLEKISQVWNNGSIIRSWILELVHELYAQNIDFSKIAGSIQEGGTGRWAVDEAKKHDVPVSLIEESLRIRKWSRETRGNYATKLVALLRNTFGGHPFEEVE